MIEAALHSLLNGDAGVSAITETRNYSVVLPQQAELPATTTSRIASPRELSHSGPTGVTKAAFQISCWAADPLTAKQLSAAVVDLLHGYSGTVSGVQIFQMQVTNELDLFDPESGVYHVPVDILATYRD